MKKLLFILMLIPFISVGQTKIRNTQLTSGNQPAGKVLTSDGSTNVVWGDAYAGTVSDATTTTKGIIQLAGDLSGNSASPTVVGLSLKENIANKENTTVDNSTTKYPTVNLLKTYADTKLPITNINGTIGYIPKFTGTNSIGNSPIYTDGTNIGIGTTTPKAIAHIGTVNSDTTPFLATGSNIYGWGMFYENTNGDLWIKPQVLGNYGNGVTIQRSSGNVGIGCLSGTETRLAIIHADGTFGIIPDGINGQVLGTDGNGGYSFVNQSGGTETTTVQSLSGTTPTFDTSLGLNAVLTISGNTTLAFSNVNVGSSGWINITNAATLYTLDLTGYNFKITQNIYGNTGYRVGLSGGSKLDRIGWSYDGSVVVISGSLSLKP